MHGIHTICHQMEDLLRLNLKKKKHTVVISENIEKAFDRVVMIGILLELNDWKMQPQIIKILKSFLTSRATIVKIDGFLSSSFPPLPLSTSHKVHPYLLSFTQYILIRWRGLLKVLPSWITLVFIQIIFLLLHLVNRKL